MAKYTNGLEDSIDLTPSAITVLEGRYLKKNETAQDMFKRVANNIAQADKNYKGSNLEETTEKFYNQMTSLHFLPNSPTLMNAGRELQQLSACFSVPMEDSIASIFGAAKNGALIHQSGGGTGYNFSNIRPKGDKVKTTNGVASGPVSFMYAFNTYTDVVKQGGTRRGANLGLMKINHPDILEFIDSKTVPDGKAKQIMKQFSESKYLEEKIAKTLIENYQLNNFNISVAVTNEFMNAVVKGEKYDLIHPISGKVVKRLDAKEVFKKIASNAWKYAEPGILYYDTINKHNQVPGLGLINNVNPCSEQMLFDWESCNLGSIDVSKFIQDDKINYPSLEETIKSSVHFLDNVIDMNKFPLEEIEKITKANRKIGLGIMGFADALIYMGIPYGSHDSIQVAENLMQFVQDKSKDMSRQLAKHRGSFPNIELSIYKGQDMRNATTTTIAPTGTIGVITGCSQGIEPLYSVVYKRTTPQFTLFESNKVFEKMCTEKGIKPDLEEIMKTGILPKELGELFITAKDLTPEQHVKMQAAFQKYVCNGISKTTNLPNNATVEDVENVYLLAHKLGCKGITVYRDGSRDVQVLNTGPEKKYRSLQNIITEEAIKFARPEIIKGETLKTLTPFGTLFLTINRKEDGTPYEIFSTIGKSGGDVQAMAEGYGRLMSQQLKSGATLDDVAHQLEGIGGKTTVMNHGHPTSSLPDAIAQTIKKHIAHYNDSNGQENKVEVPKISGNLCPDCGTNLIKSEGCEHCADDGCGFTRCG
jgi:ribonucleoside-diphosphate reductase alpha chain